MNRTISPQSTRFNSVDFRVGAQLTREHGPGSRSHHQAPQKNNNLGFVATVGAWHNPNTKHSSTAELRTYGVRRLTAAAATVLATTALIFGTIKVVEAITDDKAPAVCTGSHPVTIEQGDTIWDIAVDIPGAPADVQDEIFEMNPGLEAGRLQPGEVIEVPNTCRPTTPQN